MIAIMTEQQILDKLCINDLLNPTEKSISLLESLSTTQIDHIEQALIKIKEKKHLKSQQSNDTNNDWTLVAAQIAKALADSITSNQIKSTATNTTTTTTPATPAIPKPSSNKSNITTTTTVTKAIEKEPTTVVSNHEPQTEVKDGIEWVSFVYSHHRVLRRYSIRTDVDQVDINILDDKFKSENCVYPRANLPRDEYKGNRWIYETECNTLGWKLAYLNSEEIAGKRGLIQRAVDSYRNRYPSMRSRRVARQEKLLKGTLRKRKQRDEEALKSPKQPKLDDAMPKTVSIDDGMGNKYRIRINLESVSLDSIDMEFRKSNCVYPRAMEINTTSPFCSQRQIEESKCNELGWKLAWLNPKQLANRKNLLQRVLDIYRTKFLPELNPRKNSLRAPVSSQPTYIDTNMLTLNNNQQLLSKKDEDDESLYSGTTDSADFHECSTIQAIADTMLLSPNTNDSIMLSAPTSTNELMLNTNDCRLSITSTSSEEEELASPFVKEDQDHVLFQDDIFSLYNQFPTDIKSDDDHLIDPLMSQLFQI